MTTDTPEHIRQRFQRIHDLSIKLGLHVDLGALVEDIAVETFKLAQQGRVILLLNDIEETGLRFGALYDEPHPIADRKRVEKAFISTYNTGDLLLQHWLSGYPEKITESDSPVHSLLELLDFEQAYSLPLYVDDELGGVVLIELVDEASLDDEIRATLSMAARSMAVHLHNSRLHARVLDELAEKMHEMNLMQQIDSELNETISLNRVFDIMLDWALRFSNANAASIALYDEDNDNLRTVYHYGYTITNQEFDVMRPHSVAHRVAAAGLAEIIPDVQTDQDYIPIASNIRSQMAVPVLREDRVIAVITLESERLNGFTDAHLNFVHNLANRAAVAIDNARLYTQTERSRARLSHILNSIIDAVIVVSPEERIVLINPSARAALGLYDDATRHVGQGFGGTVQFQPLVELYRRARGTGEDIAEELTLPDGRVCYTKISPHAGIGWLIVMQDVTMYKEMDQLKNQLVATVSHDLKQPLGVMQGYLELLDMKYASVDSGGFIGKIDRAIGNMRDLIDDILDMARIESGIELKLEFVQVQDILREALDANRDWAARKSMTVSTALPADLPTISGEQMRLRQIFHNLIGNAIKYTPPGGEIKVNAEQRGDTIRIAIEDNGPGISPEDQALIFDRFYRVRRPETDGIEGTGLGLAIVKSLVEAHRGKIRVESNLGEGSIFIVTLPISRTEEEIAV